MAVKAAARHSLGQWRWRNMTNGEKADSTGLRLLLQVFRLVLRCWDHVRPKNNLCFYFEIELVGSVTKMPWNLTSGVRCQMAYSEQKIQKIGPPPHNLKDLICEGGLK